jgi:GNAT superfamily N-acetyltransferase
MIAIEISELEDDQKLIRQKLYEYNSRFVQPDHHEMLCLTVKRENQIIGGLVGGTYWNWLYIELFWIDEKERNSGLGTRILAKAEEIAIQKGCKNAHLETHDFQSLEFYLRRNYQVFGELEDLPENHKKYFLFKRLGKE